MYSFPIHSFLFFCWQPKPCALPRTRVRRPRRGARLRCEGVKVQVLPGGMRRMGTTPPMWGTLLPRREFWGCFPTAVQFYLNHILRSLTWWWYWQLKGDVNTWNIDSANYDRVYYCQRNPVYYCQRRGLCAAEVAASDGTCTSAWERVKVFLCKSTI